jgi:hypothetical protein
MHWQQTGSSTGCPDTRKLQMAAKTESSYNFGCRIDINAIPTANVGFSWHGECIGSKPEVLQVVPTTANYKWRPKTESSYNNLLNYRYVVNANI